MSKYVAVSALLIGTSVAQAQITYTAQARSVYAATNAGSQGFSSAATGVWSQGASSSYPLGSAGAGGSQTSDLRSNAIAFDGSTSASNQNAFLATSSSLLDVSFSIGEDTPFELLRTAANYGYAGMSLTSGGTTIFSYSFDTIPAQRVGVLNSGSYRFRATLTSDAPWSGPDWIVSNSAHFVLNIPSPTAAALLAIGLGFSGRRRRTP